MKTLQFKIDQHTLNEIEEIRKSIRADTYAEVVKRALGLLKISITISNGNEVDILGTIEAPLEAIKYRGTCSRCRRIYEMDKNPGHSILCQTAKEMQTPAKLSV